MFRRKLLCEGPFTFAALLCTVAPALFADDRPNILVILVDDLGYGDLACCGAEDMQTPHLDRLMADGLRMTEFYANCSVCSPTRAALMTGRYPDMVGVPGVIRTHPEDNWGYLSPSAAMLPELLRESGYRTGIVGKWHLGLESPNLPNERGFEHFHGFLGDMMDDYYTHLRHDINYLRLNGDEIDSEGHATDLFTQWACDFISTSDDEQPFFLYLTYNAPHGPIQPPEEWITRVQDREADISEHRAALVALIEHLDAGIGQVLACLENEGLHESTLVIFTSDNGGQLSAGANNGPLRDGKGSMYEGGLKVPMCVRWPGHIEAGTTTDMRAMTMDTFPTVLYAAGVSVPDAIDGVSVLPTLLGEHQADLRELWFFRRREGGTQFMGKTIEAVRMGDWKLLQNSPFAPLELYNLADDPLEQHNLIETERDVARELSSALRRQIQHYGSVPWQRPSE